MSWWNLAPDTPLFGGEYSFRDRYPQYVAKAFIAVEDSDYDASKKAFEEVVEEAIVSFAQCWGGVDDATLLRVLEQGSGRDRLAAILAIGHSPLPQAADVLDPFLESTELQERWAAACMLALHRDERAWPMLAEYLPRDAPSGDAGWYDIYRSEMAGLLATWGPAWLTPVLRQAFLNLWEREYTLGKFTNQFDYNSHDALLYALGRRGALAALHGVKLTASRRRLAMIYQALGYLRADERVTDPFDNEHLMSGLLPSDLRAEVVAVLLKQFALSEQEARACVFSYGSDYLTRMNAPYHLNNAREEEPIPAWEERVRRLHQMEES
jgi:HEAT repeat protein